MQIGKPLDKKSDEELERGLKQAERKQVLLQRHAAKYPAGVAACAILLGFYGIVKLAFMTGSAILAPLGVIAASAAAFAGVIGYSVGWARLCNGLSRRWHSDAEKIGAEKRKREIERSPSFQAAVRQAAEAAAKRLKDMFNAAVDKTFHGGTEAEIRVRGPVKLKKPGAPQKKKSFFGR